MDHLVLLEHQVHLVLQVLLVISDPLFVNPITPTIGNTPNTLGDYRIKGTSPCINTGLNTNVSIPVDVRGQQRKI
jgi:hypothetical protein